MNSSMNTRECVKVYGTFKPFVGLDPFLAGSDRGCVKTLQAFDGRGRLQTLHDS
jgi:hypothetical protein